MRCEELWENLDSLEASELPPSLREHLAGCVVCREQVKNWRLARAGLRLLADEPVPELSLGFATRLVRQLEGIAEIGRSSEVFMERAGRRFVYASLLLALTVLLALFLPSSGPLRATPTADLYFSGTETFTSESDPILPDEPAGSALPSPSAAREGSQTDQK